jgi:CheY-like chemotaxis protein
VGTGLGLAICQRIISDLGGDISAHSTPGVGTTFRIKLPPATVTEQPVPQPDSSTRAFRHGQVLVIDDDESIAATVRRMLSAEHSITTMTDAREALREIGAGKEYDLILCDLMMPTVTGMEFFRQLSAIAPQQADRVVFLTGGAFTHSARAFLDRVPNQRIDKPFNVRELRSLVNELIG